MDPKLLMQVEKSVKLTGLGVLLLTEQPTLLLQAYDLYTQWTVRLVFPNGIEAKTSASIEEVSHPADNLLHTKTVETRALLLTQEGVEPVPAGTLVYLLGQHDLFAT